MPLSFFPFFKATPVAADPLERLAKSELANSTRPDDIIVACLIESFLKDHAGWRLNDDKLTLPFGPVGYNASRNTKRLTNDKKGELAFKFAMRRVEKSHSGEVQSGIAYVDVVTFKAPDKPLVTLHPALGDLLVKHWNKISLNIKELNATAEKAKKEMEENEVKWALAEDFLGMKRVNGVLQSIRPPEAKPKTPRRPRVIKEPFHG